jgi:maltooligosyltrehalose trehalohydrolase
MVNSYNDKLKLGASYHQGQTRFTVWSPKATNLELHVVEPFDKLIPLEANEGNYYQGDYDLQPGTRYFYRINKNSDRPDPASRFQPLGVHGPSEIINEDFEWSDQEWKGLPLEKYIFYEIHVGTFSPEGTFTAILDYLEELKDLGITALEIMPVSQFPGKRNWGYDGVFPFAVQNSYGGPEKLKRLVNACHVRGLAVVLDVVYNHLGPEGNYLGEFGPYFNERYKTPWGPALNFDGLDSDPVRHYFIQNAWQWFSEFHFDALRLDAVHGILDTSAHPFLLELSEAKKKWEETLGRAIYLIPESDLNDSRLLSPSSVGGFNLDAQWMDDFHHVIHTLLTGEKKGYYLDFGTLDQLEKTLKEGFVYSGQYSAYRRRRYGNSSENIPAHKFVVYSQNHDQVGNRLHGERLSQLVSLSQAKIAASLVILSPFLPLIFMGEEYGETAPFNYFIDHGDEQLLELVRKGRSAEFASFGESKEAPDPASQAVFDESRLNHHLKMESPHRDLYNFYRELIHFRKTIPALEFLSKKSLDVVIDTDKRTLFFSRFKNQSRILAFINFSSDKTLFTLPKGIWLKKLDSDDRRWGGSSLTTLEEITSGILEMAPESFVLLQAKGNS